MPDGRTHDTSTLIGSVLLGGVAFGVTHSPETAAALAGGMALSGLYLSPDLDILGNRGLFSAMFPFGGVTQALTCCSILIGAIFAYVATHNAAAAGAVTLAALVVGWMLAPGSRPLQRWGPLVFVWAPYRLLIYVHWLTFGDKRRHPHMGHRSPLSHWPVLGDALRLLDLGLVGVVVGGLVLSALHRGTAATIVTDGRSLLIAHQSLAAMAFGGAVAATALHQTLDHIVPDRED